MENMKRMGKKLAYRKDVLAIGRKSRNVILLYKAKLIEKINEYDEILQSLVDNNHDEQLYNDVLREKRMIEYCLYLLNETKNEIFD